MNHKSDSVEPSLTKVAKDLPFTATIKMEKFLVIERVEEIVANYDGKRKKGLSDVLIETKDDKGLQEGHAIGIRRGQYHRPRQCGCGEKPLEIQLHWQGQCDQGL